MRLRLVSFFLRQSCGLECDVSSLSDACLTGWCCWLWRMNIVNKFARHSHLVVSTIATTSWRPPHILIIIWRCGYAESVCNWIFIPCFVMITSVRQILRHRPKQYARRAANLLRLLPSLSCCLIVFVYHQHTSGRPQCWTEVRKF